MEDISIATTLKVGDHGELVKRLQTALMSSGYDLGPSGADGSFGERTKVAVESFQSAHSLSPTGVADTETIAALDLDPNTLKDLIEVDNESTPREDVTRTEHAENWMLLKDGAAKVATQRLSDLQQLLTTCVSQFHDDASAQVEGLEGESHEGLGAELFNALTNVLMVAFPEEMLLEKIAAEAIKGFRDVFVAGVAHAAATSADGRLAQAKDELRRVLNDLVAATRDSATAAWHDGAAKINRDLTAFFDADPKYHNLPYDGDANATEEWISDQIGIRDAAEIDPSAKILAGLWDAFHRDFYRIAAQVRWAGQSQLSKLQFLADMEPDQRVPFLQMMGEDSAWWEEALRRWQSGGMLDPSMPQ